jgi:hypothetical protein
VSIPANPNALQLGLKAGAIAQADVEELLELLLKTTSTSRVSLEATTPRHATATTQDFGSTNELLQLARDINVLMKRI